TMLYTRLLHLDPTHVPSQDAPRPPAAPPFPYTTLFRSIRDLGGVLLLLPARPIQPHFPGHGLGRGRCRDRAARGRTPGGARACTDRPAVRCRQGEGDRDSAAG